MQEHSNIVENFYLLKIVFKIYTCYMTVPKWMMRIDEVLGFLTGSGEGLLSAVWVLRSAKPAFAKHWPNRDEGFTSLRVFLLTPHLGCVQLKQSCIQQIVESVYLGEGLEIVPVPKMVAWGTVMHSNVLWNIVNILIPNYCEYIIVQVIIFIIIVTWWIWNWSWLPLSLVALELHFIFLVQEKIRRAVFFEICVIK